MANTTMTSQISLKMVRQAGFELSSTAKIYRIARFHYKNLKLQLARLTRVYYKDVEHVGDISTNHVSSQKDEQPQTEEDKESIKIKIKLIVRKLSELSIHDPEDTTMDDYNATTNENWKEDLYSLLEKTRTQTESESGILRKPLPKPSKVIRLYTARSPISPPTKLNLARSKLNEELKTEGRPRVPFPTTTTPEESDKTGLTTLENDMKMQLEMTEWEQEIKDATTQLQTFKAKYCKYIRAVETTSVDQIPINGIPHQSRKYLKIRTLFKGAPVTISKPAIERINNTWTRNYLPKNPSSLSRVIRGRGKRVKIVVDSMKEEQIISRKRRNDDDDNDPTISRKKMRLYDDLFLWKKDCGVD